MCTHLIKRGSRYYIRRRVPSDLVPILGKTEITKALGTSDRREAERLCRVESVKLDSEWSARRVARQAKDALDEVLTTAQADADTALRASDDAEREREESSEWYQSIVSRARDDGTDEDEAMEFDREVERRVQVESAVQRRLDTTAQKARAVPPQKGNAQKASTLRDVVPSWVARNAPKDDAVRRTERALALLEESIGPVPLADLKKSHGAAFVRFLLDQSARGFGRKTAHNYASCITALLSVAEKDDSIDRNPFDLSFDKSIGAEKREPWTDAELRLMFGHTLFSANTDTVPHWHDVAPSDGRALLLILLHTGARIGEIAQIRRGDFQLQRSITAIRITAEAGTVKTAESERTVPLADHLLSDPWFAQWLSEVMDGERPGDPAFPTMTGRVHGPADTAVRWFLGFRKDAGLPLGRLHGSHKFRHWIRSALAAHNIGDATADAITGHAAQGSSGRVSYTTITLAVMLSALNALSYPTVSVT